MDDTPLVSFCIPTYNRSRYLDSLLFSLTEHLAGFPYSCEVFVSDNCSSDDTTATVERFAGQLPLRYVRHDANRGGRANYQYMMAQARGRYVVYIADDDGVIGSRVAEVIAMMEANPDVGIAYAPWHLVDLVAQQEQGQFYQQDRDVLVRRGEHRQLLDTLLHYSIFPEIYICRRELLQAVMPRIHAEAYYAFVHAAEFLQHANVLFLKEPFYVSITNYFADHQRTQGGTEEAETAWDRYRAGLEYVQGRAAHQIPEADRARYTLGIQGLIAQRIAVAVRLRFGAERDHVETYYLAYRLKAMGGEHLLSVSLDTLRAHAVLGFVMGDPELNREVQQLVCLGRFSADMAAYIQRSSPRPVVFAPTVAQLPALDASTLVFARGAISESRLPEGHAARYIHEDRLLDKFSG
jgi:poly(ribitol-phosphate) beta-N-acetylglucosaminyltransferase